MKRFWRTGWVWAVVTVSVAGALMVAGGAAAQTGSPPVKASLIFYQPSYNLDTEQIAGVVSLRPVYGLDILTLKGFSALPFDHYIYLYGPLNTNDARLITATSGGRDSSRKPGLLFPTYAAEELAEGVPITTPISELRETHPSLVLPGQYQAWLEIQFLQLDHNAPGIVPVDENNDGVPDWYRVPSKAAYLWSEPLVTQPTIITLTTSTPTVTSDIRVRCTEYVFGEGSHPGVTKYPLPREGSQDDDFQVMLFKKSDCENAVPPIPLPINHKDYQTICSRADNIPYYAIAEPSGAPGEAVFRNVPQDDYFVIGAASRATNYKHLGSPVPADDLNWGIGEIFVNLKLMTDYRGKSCPGKSKKVEGSVLWIIEPEYVEWTSNEETYPFAFESVGDWDVAVSVAPPEGFVADQDSLSESVSSALKAVQFTVTDVGTEYKPTKVKYKFKHNGKKSSLESEIDVKLSKKLADKKGLTEWGEDKEDKEDKEGKK